MEMLQNAHSYATRANAEKKLRSVKGADDERWFILALPSGRFAPCVHLLGDRVCGSMYFVQNQICVIG